MVTIAHPRAEPGAASPARGDSAGGLAGDHSSGPPNGPPGRLSDDGAVDALAVEGVELEVQVGGQSCRIVCVDGIVPGHVQRRPDGRARLVYVPGEISHFELDHHRYALVLAREEAAQGAAPAAGDLRQLLTNREMQIVQLLCLGYLTKQVADRLHLSEFTVRSYVKTIYCKLGVRSRAAMVFRYTQAFKPPPPAGLNGRGA